MDAKSTLLTDISKISKNIKEVEGEKKELVDKIGINDIELKKYEEDYAKLDISKAIIL